LTARKAAAAELQRVEAEATAALPKLNAAVDQAAAKLREAQAALESTQRAYQVALCARRNTVSAFDRAADKQRSILIESAPKVIGGFLAELASLSDADRTRLLVARQKVGTYQVSAGNGFTRSAFGPLPDDYRRASEQMLADLARARADAESLRLAALPDPETALALASIRAGLFESATTA
jgi:hypothetical protein